MAEDTIADEIGVEFVVIDVVVVVGMGVTGYEDVDAEGDGFDAPRSLRAGRKQEREEAGSLSFGFAQGRNGIKNKKKYKSKEQGKGTSKVKGTQVKGTSKGKRRRRFPPGMTNKKSKYKCDRNAAKSFALRAGLYDFGIPFLKNFGVYRCVVTLGSCGQLKYGGRFGGKALELDVRR